MDENLIAYADQPREVSLETFSQCNAACTFCPYPTLDRIGEKMPMELIDKLIDEMAEWKIPFFFSPFKVNEPLLDKRMFGICQKVLDRTLAVLRIFSNGSTLNLANINRIADLDRVVQLWVSLNEYRPEEYKNLMNLDFDHTAKNLDVLHEIDFPHKVMLSTVGYPNEDFRRYCYDRWPKFESMAIKDGGWLGYSEAQDTVVPDVNCWRWWELSIMSTGIVSLCCMDGEGRFPIGDLNKQTMLEVYATGREKRESMSRLDIYPCSTCTN